jgi:hypothetical protein
MAVMRRHLGPLALFALLAVVMVAPALRGDVLSSFVPLAPSDPASAQPAPERNALLHDPQHVFVPDFLEARRQLRAGKLPLWTSGVGAGRPLLASQQFAPFFPTSLPLLVADPAHAAALKVALGLLLAALGTYLLCLRLGLSRWPSAVGGAAYGFSPYLVAWAQHPQINVWCLLPWTLVAAQALARRPAPGPALALGCLGGVQLLGGHPQSVLLQLPLVVAWLAFSLPRGATRARAWLWLAAASAWAAGCSAVMWLPFLDALGGTEGASRGVPGAPLETLWGLMLPSAWGLPQEGFLEGPLNYAERSAYVGAVPLLCALIGLRGRSSRDQRFFAAAAALALVLAIGLLGTRDAMSWVPGLGDLNQIRLLVVVTLCLAMLAAIGVQRIATWERDERAAAVRFGAVLVALPMLWLVRHDVAAGDIADTLADAAGFGGAPVSTGEAGAQAVIRWLVLATGGLLLIALVGRPRTLAIAVAGIAALELATLGGEYHTFVDRAEADTRPAVAQALQDTADGGRVVGVGVALAPNVALRMGLRDAQVHDHPPLGRYARLWTGLVGGATARTMIDPARGDSGKLLDLFGVGAAVVPPRTPAPPGTEVVVQYPTGTTIAANRDYVPRVQLTGSASPVADGTAALREVRRRDVKELQRVPVVEGLGERPEPAAARGLVALDGEGAGWLEVRTSAPARGLLVVNDSYDEGWRATVDGGSVPVLPANVAFRAVAVPAGDHLIRLEYAPTSAAIGFWCSIAFLVASLLAAVVLWVRAEERPTRPAADSPSSATPRRGAPTPAAPSP